MAADLQTRLDRAMAYVQVVLPNVSPVLAALDIRADERVATAGVTASGRLLIAPAFAETLSVRQLAFVLAHELYHLIYEVFARLGRDTTGHRRWLANVAHDFIVNDKLREDFRNADDVGVGADFVPPGALLWENYSRDYRAFLGGSAQPPISRYSLESLILELERMQGRLPKGNFLRRISRPVGRPSARPPSDALGSLADAFPTFESPKETAVEEPPSDDRLGLDEALRPDELPELIDAELERELFPDETEVERVERRERIRAQKELADVRTSQVLRVRDNKPGTESCLLSALAGRYVAPWEAALQRYVDEAAPQTRTWARASRRAADRTDVVLPGRQTAGWLLNVILDTSGSMECELSRVLGMIQSFGRSAGCSRVRIVQCDEAVFSDETVEIEALASYRIGGLGGSDMTPAMLKLAEEATVESVLVLTDGGIDIPPAESVPYRVVWGVVGDWTFEPDYGEVLRIPEADE